MTWKTFLYPSTTKQNEEEDQKFLTMHCVEKIEDLISPSNAKILENEEEKGSIEGNLLFFRLKNLFFLFRVYILLLPSLLRRLYRRRLSLYFSTEGKLSFQSNENFFLRLPLKTWREEICKLLLWLLLLR